MTGPVGIAVVGAGKISEQYLKNIAGMPDLSVRAIADIDTERAAAAAEQYGIPASGDLDAVLALPDVEIVLNLTIPAAHADVDLAAIHAGKHVFSEKPLALDPVAGAALLAQAQSRGLLVGCAPDTVLGAGLQSARRALESGVIGTPVAVMTMVENPGPERWHPNPEFLFQVGAGPLFDLGPYYLTALTVLLGPIDRVSAVTRTGRSTRTIGSGPLAGSTFQVRTPSHVAALMDFAGGASASSIFSFESSATRMAIEITGTEGTLSVPDPNTFGGPLQVRHAGDEEWTALPVAGTTAGRGIGLLDMARSLRAGTSPRASGALAQHVVEAMTLILVAGESHTVQKLESSAPPTVALPDDWDPAAATL